MTKIKTFVAAVLFASSMSVRAAQIEPPRALLAQVRESTKALRDVFDALKTQTQAQVNAAADNSRIACDKARKERDDAQLAYNQLGPAATAEERAGAQKLLMDATTRYDNAAKDSARADAVKAEYMTRERQASAGCVALGAAVEQANDQLKRYIKQIPGPADADVVDVFGQADEAFEDVVTLLKSYEGGNVPDTCKPISATTRKRWKESAALVDAKNRGKLQIAALNAVLQASKTSTKDADLGSRLDDVVQRSLTHGDALVTAGGRAFTGAVDTSRELMLFPDPEQGWERQLSGMVTAGSLLAAAASPSVFSGDVKARNITVAAAGVVAIASQYLGTSFAGKAIDRVSANRVLGLAVQSMQQDVVAAKKELDRVHAQTSQELRRAAALKDAYSEETKTEMGALADASATASKLAASIAGNGDPKGIPADRFVDMKAKYDAWNTTHQKKVTDQITETAAKAQVAVTNATAQVQAFQALLSSTRRLGLRLRELLGPTVNDWCQAPSNKDSEFCRTEPGQGHFAASLITQQKREDLAAIGRNAFTNAEDAERDGKAAIAALEGIAASSAEMWTSIRQDIEQQGQIIAVNAARLAQSYAPEPPLSDEYLVMVGRSRALRAVAGAWAVERLKNEEGTPLRALLGFQLLRLGGERGIRDVDAQFAILRGLLTEKQDPEPAAIIRQTNSGPQRKGTGLKK